MIQLTAAEYELMLAKSKEADRLAAVVAEVHSWIVCATIASPQDMMQNAERIIEITKPR